jgi:hypothetical protein
MTSGTTAIAPATARCSSSAAARVCPFSRSRWHRGLTVLYERGARPGFIRELALMVQQLL